MIKYAALIVATAAASLMYAVSGSSRTIAGPPKGGHYVPTEFDILYGTNCAGCHGADGKGGAARGLADPVFLRIADDATLRSVMASGVSGTAMPAFAKTAGGPLSDEQIDALVAGMRGRWAGAAGDNDVNTPPYA